MEFRQLEAFVAVVREGSFTQAAVRLNLTQPSLSARIHQLEQQMGTPLFDRNTRPVELSIAGETFFPYAERVLGVLEAGQNAVQVANMGMGGRISVGAPTSISTFLMPNVVTRFTSVYPQAELSITNGHSALLVQQLRDGILDIVFTAVFPHLIRQNQILMRVRDRIIVACEDNHPLSERDEVSIQELWDHRIVLPSWGSAFEGFIASYREMSSSPHPMIRVPLAVGLPMMSLPDAITFVPQRVARAANLIEINVPEFNYPWDVVLVTRPGRSLTPLGQGFVNLVESILG
ncbi:MAG: LysR family transcriptional regulator [Chloroflexota bacterium]